MVLLNMVFFCCLVGYGLVPWIHILHSINSRLIGNFDFPIQPTKHSPASTKIQWDCPPHSEQPGRPLSRQHRRRQKSNVDVNHTGKPKAKWKKWEPRFGGSCRCCRRLCCCSCWCCCELLLYVVLSLLLSLGGGSSCLKMGVTGDNLLIGIPVFLDEMETPERNKSNLGKMWRRTVAHNLMTCSREILKWPYIG